MPFLLTKALQVYSKITYMDVYINRQKSKHETMSNYLVEQAAGERERQLSHTNAEFGRGSSGTAEAQAIISQNRSSVWRDTHKRTPTKS